MLVELEFKDIEQLKRVIDQLDDCLAYEDFLSGKNLLYELLYKLEEATK